MSTPENQTFDVESEDIPTTYVQTRIYVIAGGPCSGKTTILNALRERKYKVEYEGAEQLLKQEIANGKNAEQVRHDPIEWQKRVTQADFDLFSNIAPDKLTFTDTSLIETYVFSKMAGIKFGTNLSNFMNNTRFAEVFFLEPLDTHETTQVRMEDQETAQALGKEIFETYNQFGYQPLRIPATDPGQRIDNILAYVSGS